MNVYKCFRGHVSSSVDCPYCLVEEKKARELYELINDEDEKREL